MDIRGIHGDDLYLDLLGNGLERLVDSDPVTELLVAWRADVDSEPIIITEEL